ncbi:MAG: hypothetical protein ACFFD4_12015 [Candidatus Odinarchaeota archaeon]
MINAAERTKEELLDMYLKETKDDPNKSFKLFSLVKQGYSLEIIANLVNIGFLKETGNIFRRLFNRMLGRQEYHLSREGRVFIKLILNREQGIKLGPDDRGEIKTLRTLERQHRTIFNSDTGKYYMPDDHGDLNLMDAIDTIDGLLKFRVRTQDKGPTKNHVLNKGTAVNNTEIKITSFRPNNQLVPPKPTKYQEESKVSNELTDRKNEGVLDSELLATVQTQYRVSVPKSLRRLFTDVEKAYLQPFKNNSFYICTKPPKKLVFPVKLTDSRFTIPSKVKNYFKIKEGDEWRIILVGQGRRLDLTTTVQPQYKIAIPKPDLKQVKMVDSEIYLQPGKNNTFIIYSEEPKTIYFEVKFEQSQSQVSSRFPIHQNLRKIMDIKIGDRCLFTLLINNKILVQVFDEELFPAVNEVPKSSNVLENNNRSVEEDSHILIKAPSKVRVKRRIAIPKCIRDELTITGPMNIFICLDEKRKCLRLSLDRPVSKVAKSSTIIKDYSFYVPKAWHAFLNFSPGTEVIFSAVKDLGRSQSIIVERNAFRTTKSNVTAKFATFHGIETLAKFKQVIDGKLPKALLYRDPDLLNHVYHILKWSDLKIAEKSGCSKRTVLKCRKKYNIEARSMSESARLRYEKELPFNDGSELGETLTGLMLSDGHLNKVKCQSYFELGMTSRSREYVEYIAELFSSNGYKTRMRVYRIRDKDYIYLLTNSSLKLHYYRNKWYPSGKKIVPSDVQLTSRICLHWYLGDGTYIKSRQAVRLCTEGFKKDEVLSLLDLLKKTLSISSGVTYIKSQNSIRLDKNAALVFLKYIGGQSPFQCFDYKFSHPNLVDNG